MNQNPLRLALSIVLAVLLISCLSAQSSGRLISEGDSYFEAGRFRNALQYYMQGGNMETWGKSTKLKVAICQYAINDVDSSIRTLNRLVSEGKTDGDVFFYLARAYQQRNQFQEAIENYKEFIKRTNTNDSRIPWVKDEILRCAVGKSLKHGEETAYVENLGTSINSFYDEFGPVPSPNYLTRLYVTAARENSLGGLITPEGEVDPGMGHPLPDIWYTDLEKGSWSALRLLDAPVNSADSELLEAFGQDGQSLYFRRGPENGGVLLVDSFAVDDQVYSPDKLDLNAMDPDIRDLYFFNDTIVLFSSTRDGGYGGLDLWSSVKSHGKWQAPVNLGPAINSYYDERHPFLTRNGRSLYFSSNNTKSIGGLDIFKAEFDTGIPAWRTPVNLGLPINSAGDDAYWSLSSDGLSAYFSSDRKSGFGKRDVYVAYLKSPVDAHLQVSDPPTFTQFVKPGTTIAMADAPKRPAQIKEYYISNLYYDNTDQVLTPQNMKKLNLLVNMLKIYPGVKVVITSHDISSGPKAFDLYFSIKKAEKAAEFLMNNGINRSRIILRGAGAQYPLAQQPENGIPSPIVERLNRRMEIKVLDAEDPPLKLIYEKPNIPENVLNASGLEYANLTSGLVYRVQIVSVNHLYQNPILEEDFDVLVEFDPNSANYRYLLGVKSTYKDALALRSKLRESGFEDAFVVPYINDKRISNSELKAYLEQYPDLANMLN